MYKVTIAGGCAAVRGSVRLARKRPASIALTRRARCGRRWFLFTFSLIQSRITCEALDHELRKRCPSGTPDGHSVERLYEGLHLSSPWFFNHSETTPAT